MKLFLPSLGHLSKVLFIVLPVCLSRLNGSAQPVIGSFYPISAPAGTTITISGTNFNPVPEMNTVYIKSNKTTVLTASSTSLTVKAIGGTNSAITVTTGGLTAYSRLPFSITFPGAPGIVPSNFAAPQNSKLFIRALDGALGDIDGDGKLDLVMTETSIDGPSISIVSVSRNTSSNSKISFAPKLKLSNYGDPWKVALADFDGDGKLDMAALNYTWSNVSIHKNTSVPGQISFLPYLAVPTGSTLPTGIGAADLDGDGRPEVFIQLRNTIVGDAIGIFRNTSASGNISFASPKLYPGNVASTGDINGDGKPELAIDNKVYENKSTPGNLEFVAAFTAVAAQISKIIDVDSDGKVDLVIANNGIVTVFRNTTSNAISFSDTGLSIGFYLKTMADLNGDGKPDFLFSNFGTNPYFVAIPNATNNNQILLGQPSATALINSGNMPLIGDLDGDGKPELLVNSLDSLCIQRNITGEPVVIPSGSNPVTGEIMTKVMVEQAAPVYNSKPYLQRHYDIEPETNAATASANITLTFSQDDFNQFNSNPSHGMDLPSSPADLLHKANFRIFQHHGTSPSSIPGTYTGDIVEIDPDDANINWNDSAKVWQVSFTVSGFSGFFAGSAPAVALPLALHDFTTRAVNSDVVLTWSSSNETAFDRFDIQRSTDAVNFKTIHSTYSSADKNYRYIDMPGAYSLLYYRLKMIDKDASFSYSDIARVTLSSENRLTVFPNPAREFIRVSFPATANETVFKLIDISGKIVKVHTAGRGQSQTTINLKNLLPGNYQLLWLNKSEKIQVGILIN